MTEPLEKIILEPTEENFDFCAKILSGGDVVAVPTETVYGLAGNALNTESLKRIFAVKERPFYNPLIVHCADYADALEHIETSPETEALAKAFWPGPLTIIAKKKGSIPDLVTAGLPSVAIRVPSHPVFRTLLTKVPFPLAAPSANPFGYVSPTSAKHVEATIGNKIKAIIDGGDCLFGLESTIIDLRDPSSPNILRFGPISQSDIQNALPSHTIRSKKSTGNSSETEPQVGPGLLSKHYSPRAKVRLFAHGADENRIVETTSLEHSAVIFQQQPLYGQNNDNVFWLSDTGSLSEVAQNLFRLMQDVDRKGFETIFIERSKAVDIGIAINDRLMRAASE